MIHTPEKKAAIVARVRNGETPKAIAADTGLPAETVRRWCRADGMVLQKSYSEAATKEAVNLMAGGLGYTDTARKTGIPEGTLRDMWTRHQGKKGKRSVDSAIDEFLGRKAA